MVNLEDISTKIDNNEQNINDLDKKINTDEALREKRNEIKGIYNNISKISDKIGEIQDENTKKEYKGKILNIKRKFADLMNNRILDGEFKDVNDKDAEQRFDTINKKYISDLEDIIRKNFDKIDTIKINVNDLKDELINTDKPYEIMESINYKLTDEEKITLLKEISDEDIPPEYITVIAGGFGFESGLILAGETGLIKLSYIKYGSGCIIIGEGKIVDGKDYEDAYQKYIIENKSEIKGKVDGINTYDKSTLYESDTSDIEKREKIQKAQIDDIENGITPEEYEFVQKIGVFTTTGLKGGKDSIKAELYGKGTTGGSDVSLGYGGGISWIHKTDNKTKITTTFGISGNLINFSSTSLGTDDKGSEIVTGGLQREEPKTKYSIQEKINFNGLIIGGTVSTKDFNKVQASAYCAYKTKNKNTEFFAGITNSFKDGVPGEHPSAVIGIEHNF